MSARYLRLEEAPRLIHPGNPSCGACRVEVGFDGEQWLCPSCGTSWPPEHLEADAKDAMLFPDWSGETLTGPVCPNDQAWLLALIPPDERDRRAQGIVDAAAARR